MWPQVAAQTSAQAQVVVGPWTQTCLQVVARLRGSSYSLIITEAMDSNTDPDYSKAKDLQISLSYNSDNNDTIILGGSIGYPKLYWYGTILYSVNYVLNKC